MPQISVEVAAGIDDALLNLEGVSYPPSGTPTVDETGGSMYIQRDKGGAGGNYRLSVGVIRFDTSSIPDNATVTSGTLDLRAVDSFVASDVDGLFFVAEYYTWTPSATTADYTVTASNSAHTGTSLSSLNSAGYKNFALQNLTNINKSGYTGFRLHISEGAGAPTGADYFGVWTYNAGGGFRPSITVNYSLPTTRLAPDAILAQTNLTGAVSVIQDDPDSADANWLTAP